MTKTDDEMKTFTHDVAYTRATRQAGQAYRLLHQESERGCVLVAGAMLDEVLGALLRAYFIRDDQLSKELLQLPNAACATFSSRIRLCRALELITDETFLNLERIRAIRNRAAHFDRRGDNGFQFSFGDVDVTGKCRAITVVDEELRSSLPPRVLFEIFATMVPSLLAEHAVAGRVVGDNMGQNFARDLMMKLCPTIDFVTPCNELAKKIISLLKAPVSELPVEDGL